MMKTSIEELQKEFLVIREAHEKKLIASLHLYYPKVLEAWTVAMGGELNFNSYTIWAASAFNLPLFGYTLFSYEQGIEPRYSIALCRADRITVVNCNYWIQDNEAKAILRSGHWRDIYFSQYYTAYLDMALFINDRLSKYRPLQELFKQYKYQLN